MHPPEPPLSYSCLLAVSPPPLLQVFRIAGMHCRCSVRAIVGGELAWTGRQNVTEVEEWLGYT